MNQKKRILGFLTAVTKNVPFYFDYTNSSFDNIPIVKKEYIRNNYSIFLSSKIDSIFREEILSILQDKSIFCIKSHNELAVLDNVIFEETTGTSGIPFRVVKTKAERTQIGLYLWKLRKKVDKYVNFQNYYLFNHTGLNEQNPDVYNYDEKHICNIYENVLQRESRWIHTSIAPLKKHMEILKENNKLEFPNLKYIELTGNYLHADEVKRVEDFFQVRVLNLYGSMEVWQMAYSKYGDKLRICDENIFLEIIDDKGAFITNTNEVGNIVVTCLHLKLMPLIRYNTGDRGAYAYDVNEGVIYIELEEEREINLMKGFSEKKIGSKQFGNVLSIVKRKYNLEDIKYIQFVQVEIDTILIYVNYILGLNEVLEEIFRITEERLEKKFKFKVSLLSEEEIAQRKYEKNNLFICKC